jgi:hypothetical protein
MKRLSLFSIDQLILISIYFDENFTVLKVIYMKTRKWNNISFSSEEWTENNLSRFYHWIAFCSMSNFSSFDIQRNKFTLKAKFLFSDVFDLRIHFFKEFYLSWISFLIRLSTSLLRLIFKLKLFNHISINIFTNVFKIKRFNFTFHKRDNIKNFFE